MADVAVVDQLVADLDIDPVPITAAAPAPRPEKGDGTPEPAESFALNRRRRSLAQATAKRDVKADIVKMAPGMRTTRPNWKFCGLVPGTAAAILVFLPIPSLNGTAEQKTSCIIRQLLLLIMVALLPLYLTDRAHWGQLPRKWTPSRDSRRVPSCVRDSPGMRGSLVLFWWFAVLQGMFVFAVACSATTLEDEPISAALWSSTPAAYYRVDGLSDTDQAAWDAVVDEVLLPAFPDIPRVFVELEVGSGYTDDIVNKGNTVDLERSTIQTYSLFVGIVGWFVALANWWEKTPQATVAAARGTAVRLFPERFVAIFEGIEDSVAVLTPDPARMKKRGWVSVLVTVGLGVGLLHYSATTRKNDLFFDTQREILSGFGTFAIPSPLFATTAFGKVVHCWGAFAPPVFSQATIVHVIYLPAAVALERAFHRFAILGRLVDCFASERHEELTAAGADSQHLLEPLVSLTTASDLLSWHELRTFVRCTTAHVDMQSAELVTKLHIVGGCGCLAYLLSSVFISGYYGQGASGTHVSLLIPILCTTGLHLLSLTARIGSWTAHHVEELRDNNRQIALELLQLAEDVEAGADEAYVGQLERAVTAIEETIVRIEAHDQRPTLLGFEVTPRFASVILGYCASAALALATTVLME